MPFGSLVTLVASFVIYGAARVEAMKRAVELDDLPVEVGAFD